MDSSDEEGLCTSDQEEMGEEFYQVQKSYPLNVPLTLSDNFFLNYYASFENNSYSWLNSAIALLLNNRTLYCSLKLNEETPLIKLMKLYRQVTIFMNVEPLSIRRFDFASEKIKHVQALAIAYLTDLFQHEPGKPDLFYQTVMQLLESDREALSLFTTSLSRSVECRNCKTSKMGILKKPVITLTKGKFFDATKPTLICACPVCKIPNQNILYSYQNLPPCLLFHFNNVGGEGVLEQMNFRVGARTYYLTGVVIQSGSVSCLSTWIRNPALNQWLEFSDSGPKVPGFKDNNPVIHWHTIRMLCFEAMDQMGIVINSCTPIETNNMPLNSDCPKINSEIENHAEANPSESTSIAANLSSPTVTKMSLNVVSEKSLPKEKKCVLQDTASVQHVASDKKSSVSVRKRRSTRRPAVVMTEYEERVMNMTIDSYMSDFVCPMFGFN